MIDSMLYKWSEN